MVIPNLSVQIVSTDMTRQRYILYQFYMVMYNDTTFVEIISVRKVQAHMPPIAQAY